MVKVVASLVVALQLFLACTAVADNQEHGWVIGVGQHSCGTFLAALREHAPNGEGYHMQGALFVSASNLYEQWIWGYVTAESSRYGLPAKGDGAGITQWVAH